MVSANIKAKNRALDIDNLFPIRNVSLLKSACIYGANASGKSNLFQAFLFMRTFVLHSTRTNSGEKIDVEPFLLSTETNNEPSLFEIIFIVDDVRYRYGFELSDTHVHTEWLYRSVKREVELFWREDGKIDISSAFKEGKGLEERTRPNALFLTVCDQWNGEIAAQLIRWFKQANIISGLDDKTHLPFTLEQFVRKDGLSDEVVSLIRKLDLGIRDIIVERYGGDFVVQTVHQRFDGEQKRHDEVLLDMEKHESKGTQKIFALSGRILDSLKNGTVLFIDELNARLHPLMTETIVEMFNSADTNPHNAQLILVAHDSNLLTNDLFRRDQIWFAEKSKFGTTDLYSLSDYQGVRNDADYEANYLIGRYGAIPFVRKSKKVVLEV